MTKISRQNWNPEIKVKKSVLETIADLTPGNPVEVTYRYDFPVEIGVGKKGRWVKFGNDRIYDSGSEIRIKDAVMKGVYYFVKLNCNNYYYPFIKLSNAKVLSAPRKTYPFDEPIGIALEDIEKIRKM